MKFHEGIDCSKRTKHSDFGGDSGSGSDRGFLNPDPDQGIFKTNFWIKYLEGEGEAQGTTIRFW